MKKTKNNSQKSYQIKQIFNNNELSNYILNNAYTPIVDFLKLNKKKFTKIIKSGKTTLLNIGSVYSQLVDAKGNSMKLSSGNTFLISFLMKGSSP